MELSGVYLSLAILLLISYGIPYLVTKKFYLGLGMGMVIFYLLAALFVFLMDSFDLDNGNYPIADNILLAFFVGIPIALILNLILILLFYLYKTFNKKK